MYSYASMKRELDQKRKENSRDLDRIHELGFIDRDEWLISRWRLEMGAFDLVSGHWVAERFPNLHALITAWIGVGNLNYHIDRDLVLRWDRGAHGQALIQLMGAWYRLILNKPEICPD